MMASLSSFPQLQPVFCLCSVPFHLSPGGLASQRGKGGSEKEENSRNEEYFTPFFCKEFC